MPSPFETLLYWIGERHNIYLDRLAGRPKPWTEDPILQQYKFCNVYRELDTVTKWIDQHWRGPMSVIDDDHMWFAMCVARLFNWPDTLQAIGYPVPWRPHEVLGVLHARKQAEEKVFSGAYIVSTNGRAMDKATYVVRHVLNPLWAQRKTYEPTTEDMLESFHTRLSQANGMGSFMSAQIVADLKYVHPLNQAKDWMDFAASGPGSRRGLNRVLGREVRAPWTEQNWRKALSELHARVLPRLYKLDMPPLHAQDLQNCLCEFDKYMRTANGEGRPRSTYPGI